MVALGIQPARASTRLRFLLKGDKSPAAGYKLMARAAEPDAKAFEVGITDRDGRVELPADFAEGLVILRVIAGNDEPMADLPVMPGETRTERSIVFEGRPRTLDLEAKLDALRDAIIDVVASRSRLEARMKARIEGEDLAGFDEALAEFRKLTPATSSTPSSPAPDRRRADRGRDQDLGPDQERPEPARRNPGPDRPLPRRRPRPRAGRSRRDDQGRPGRRGEGQSQGQAKVTWPEPKSLIRATCRAVGKC